MKNFWRQVTGPTGQLSKTRREHLLTRLLSPFFFLLLVSLLVGSVGAFLLRTMERKATKTGRKIEGWLSESQLPEKVKIPLQKMVPWTATALLGVLLIAVISHSSGKIWQLILPGTKSAAEVNEGKILLQQKLALPEEVNLASEAARAQLLAPEIQELTRQASAPARMDLSQEEKINLALAYFYLGDQEQYNLWLQAAREMDPNESFFSD